MLDSHHERKLTTTEEDLHDVCHGGAKQRREASWKDDTIASSADIEQDS